LVKLSKVNRRRYKIAEIKDRNKLTVPVITQERVRTGG